MAKTAAPDQQKGVIEALNTVGADSKSAAQIAEPIITKAKEKAVQTAIQLMGQKPAYQWGGKTPRTGLDRSSFVAYALNEAGLLPNYAQYNSSALQQRFGIDSQPNPALEPGDLIFYSQGLCMMYVGNGEMIGMLPEGVVQKKVSDAFGYVRLGVGKVGIAKHS